MAGNTGNGHRAGAVAKRVQYQDEKSRKWCIIDTETGKVIRRTQEKAKGIRQKKKEDIKMKKEKKTKTKTNTKPKTTEKKVKTRTKAKTKAKSV